MIDFQPSLSFAEKMTQEDPLRNFRARFSFPKHKNGADPVYFVGNSLGLCPKKAREYVDEELQAWERLAVEGHFNSKHPWYSYHETVTEPLARVVGAKPSEVVCMNSLTVNLHLMLVSFYRPTKQRHKIIIESGAFTSDRYAVCSQIKFHGFDPKTSLIELQPREGAEILEPADITDAIAHAGDGLALVLLGNVNYRTGQAFDMKQITAAAHRVGAIAGFDLAHGAGNLNLKLHDAGVDFAAWCSYKYLNAGPGGLSGIFVHERHGQNFDLPRFAGWWGHDKARRFEMSPEFSPMKGAEGWQLSNPSILPLAALRASLEIFDEAGIEKLSNKSRVLTSYFEFLLREKIGNRIEIVTPTDSNQRGCHLSVKLKKPGGGKKIVEDLLKRGVLCDYRHPDVIRAAPVPLYNSFVDVYRFVEEFDACLKGAHG